ncbi:hypothetical protein Pint_34173 [Pistacia integerrima]|uniref:Uncharacterized protein n=1 Tax=Pistacia integerrima TaxID=434235 RepID=A0ACC0X7J9_9ROSI|nr:hypothetical protein Pint_34173 [Pistacia integerrima]
MSLWLSISSLVLSFLLGGSSAEQCGRQAGGELCPGGQCCSQSGWCGTKSEYCTTGCQSQCGSGGGGGGIGSIISRSTFDQMLKHRNGCPSKGFYSYDAFIEAAKAYPAFATTGDAATRKREVAAFLAQTSHETTGGWPSAPDGPYAWGYCFLREQEPKSSYCDPKYPCPKQYFGRGPIQLSWNYNYQKCGNAIGVDLINNPDLLATNAVISFSQLSGSGRLRRHQSHPATMSSPEIGNPLLPISRLARYRIVLGSRRDTVTCLALAMVSLIALEY